MLLACVSFQKGVNNEERFKIILVKLDNPFNSWMQSGAGFSRERTIARFSQL